MMRSRSRMPATPPLTVVMALILRRLRHAGLAAGSGRIRSGGVAQRRYGHDQQGHPSPPNVGLFRRARAHVGPANRSRDQYAQKWLWQRCVIDGELSATACRYSHLRAGSQRRVPRGQMCADDASPTLLCAGGINRRAVPAGEHFSAGAQPVRNPRNQWLREAFFASGKREGGGRASRLNPQGNTSAFTVP